MRRKVELTVPASTANLGPGFDCLGLALGLYHRLIVEEEEGEGLEIVAHGEGTDTVPLGEENIVFQAMAEVMSGSGYRPGRLRMESHNEIPLARGLGSSAAALLAGLGAGLLLVEGELDKQRLIELGTGNEGHPDNVVPCALGGLTVAVNQGERVEWVHINPPEELKTVVAIPAFSLPTREARRVLPDTVSFADAVANVGRVALLVSALGKEQLELLRIAMEDRLHQPYRAKLVPGLDDVRGAALKAGALGVALSGAGPTVMALIDGAGEAVETAMAEAWRRVGIEARALTLPIDREGIRGEICVERDRR